MEPFVLTLDQAGVTLDQAGGKGVNLSRLIEAGFPVPPGFVVSTSAYRRFVDANALEEPILRLAASPASERDVASAEIRRLFDGGEFPAELVAEIRRAHAALPRELGDPLPLAVRSSATAEDLPGASFAGQQDSYLNVRGEAELLHAVRRCWSSLWTARALSYRAHEGIEPGSVSIAVVVQTLVRADAAGIMFTADPVTGARDAVLIEAAWGLGEAVVGGLVTPDRFVVDKATGTTRLVAVAEKTVMTVPTGTGTHETPVDPARRRHRVLDDEEAAELARLGAQIEKSFGTPQDIEWCRATDQFFIVQARPITALPDEVSWESPVPGAKWVKDLQAAEWATEPLSRLGGSTTFPAMVLARQTRLPMQRKPWSAEINGWLYIRADIRVLRLVAHLVGAVVRIRPGVLDGDQRVRRLWPTQLALLDSLERTALPTRSDEELRSHAERVLRTLGWWWWEVSWDAAVALASEQLLGRLAVPGLADPAVLFRGNESMLLEGERALRRAAADADAIEDYLARFGHSTESADPIHPTLRESPELLVRHLAIARQSEVGPDERLARIRAEREEAETLVRATGGARGAFARRLLSAGQSHAAQVDDAVFHFQRVLAVLRATFLEAGRRLVRAGVLDAAEDVFHLMQSEVFAPPADTRSRVARREAVRNGRLKLAPPAFVPPISDPAWETDRMWKLFGSATGAEILGRGAQERGGKRVVVGTPGAPGRAHGIARVIRGPADFAALRPGDVLVTHATTPIWTPLFDIAAAAVTEVGGPFSHASIVAREFGIPLVTGALDATQVISDGSPVTVDGSAGVVELE